MENKPTIAIITAIWERSEMTNFVLGYYAGIKKEELNCNLELLCVGSEGGKSRRIAENHGWKYIDYPNQPLNHKFNQVSQFAKLFNPDGVLLIGSDNMVTKELINYYANEIQENNGRAKVLGLKDSLIYKVYEDNLLRFKGYSFTKQLHRQGEPIGAGRFFGKDAMEAVGWMLWPDDVQLSKGLDYNCLLKLKMAGYRAHGFDMDEKSKLVVFGIKHKTFLTEISSEKDSFEDIPGAGQYLSSIFGKETSEGIMCLAEILRNKYPLEKDCSHVPVKFRTSQSQPIKTQAQPTDIALRKTKTKDEVVLIGCEGSNVHVIDSEEKASAVTQIVTQSEKVLNVLARFNNSGNIENVFKLINQLKSKNMLDSLKVITDNIEILNNVEKHYKGEVTIFSHAGQLPVSMPQKEFNGIACNYAPANLLFNKLTTHIDSRYFMYFGDDALFSENFFKAVIPFITNNDFDAVSYIMKNQNAPLVPSPDKEELTPKLNETSISQWIFSSKFANVAQWDEYSMSSYRVCKKLYDNTDKRNVKHMRGVIGIEVL